MKLTKAAADYTTRDGSRNCGTCRFMNDDGTCDKVKGIVDRAHVCRLYKAEKPAQR